MSTTNLNGFPFPDYVFIRFASHERTFKMDFLPLHCKSQESSVLHFLSNIQAFAVSGISTFTEDATDAGFTFYERLVCGHPQTSLWLALSAGKQG